MTAYFERDLARNIFEAFGQMPVVRIPRCKTTIVGYNGTEVVRLGEKFWALPINLILS